MTGPDILKTTIDWDDATEPTVAGGGFNNGGSIKNHKAKCIPEGEPGHTFGDTDEACVDNSNTQPGFLTFSHTYACIVGGEGWGEDPLIPEACVFKPKVRITDNWGWCTKVSPGMLYGDDCNLSGADSWIEFAGQVVVEP